MTFLNHIHRLCASVAGCLIAVVPLFLNCTTQITDGGGSRGGNPVVIGRVINPDGTGASHTIVQLFPESHDPVKDKPIPDSSTDTTDKNGFFSLHTSGPNIYNVEAVHIYNRTRLLVQKITVKENNITIDSDTLRKSGAILIPIINGFDSTNGYVYVPGTNIVVSLSGKSDYVILDSIPAGTTLTLKYATKNSTATPEIIKDSVHILPSDTAKVLYAKWNSQKIYLNTTQSGANVSGDVYNFPVLIRLTAPAFNFSHTASNGQDIRFTKADGTQLPYEIEQWDSLNGHAEIWVKVDTILGANSTQSITMYWGNNNAKNQSDGTTVFDTSAGFVGVWHLNRSCDDATGNKFNGTNSGAVDSAGMIGSAIGFNGNEGIKIPGLLGQPQSITLSAWVRLDTTQSWGSEVISLGNAVLLRMDQTKAPAGGVKGSFHINSDTTWDNITSDTYLQKTGWHYLTFAIDGVNHTQSLLIDGIVYSYRTLQAPIYYSGMGTDTWIGRHGNKELNWFFNGVIDEVRVSRVANSTDWSKLCYMNQKSNDALVSFK